MQVLIEGSGLAAHSCARLLQARRHHVQILAHAKRKRPTLLLNAATRSLIEDTFGFRPDASVRVSERVVLWGDEKKPVRFPHEGTVIDEADLIASLKGQPDEPVDRPEWRVYSDRESPHGNAVHFGSRTAAAVSVTLSVSCETCFVESVPAGWLFLLPGPNRRGSLLAVGGDPESLLHDSRLVNRQIANLESDRQNFPCHPRMCWPVSGSGWLACGSAAIAFDPICGEGAGHALREAILASAVITRNEPMATEHYASRLLLGFLRHLELARTFYVSGPRTPWWQEQVAAIDKGVDWARNHLGHRPPASYALVGDELRAL